MDEFFETLTLIQTGCMERVPAILFGKDFWHKATISNSRRAGHDQPPAIRTSSISWIRPTKPEIIRCLYRL